VLSLPLLAGLLLSQNVARADSCGPNPSTTGPTGLCLTLSNTSGDAGIGVVIVDPYTMTLASVNSVGTVINGTSTVLVIPCDDFTGHITDGQSWDVVENSISSVGLNGPQKFPNNVDDPQTSPATSDPLLQYISTSDYGTIAAGAATLGQIQLAYDAAGYIAQELIAGGAGVDNSNGDLSYALWTIFDPALYGSEPNSDNAGVTTVLNNAFALATANGSTALAKAGVVIFTPVPDNTDGPQEFISVDTNFQTTSVPEPSTMAFLGFNFLAVPGVLFFVRRRSRRDA
jgi:hypothetical protein